MKTPMEQSDLPPLPEFKSEEAKRKYIEWMYGTPKKKAPE